jgi:hypothetical protein
MLIPATHLYRITDKTTVIPENLNENMGGKVEDYKREKRIKN